MPHIREITPYRLGQILWIDTDVGADGCGEKL